MILTSHQPDFLPYLGFFYKVSRSAILVLSDDVMFSKKGMHNWNRIKTTSGSAKLTIPVHAHHDTPLKDILVSEPRKSIRSVIKTLQQNYKKAEHYRDGEELLEIMDSFSTFPELHLVELNESLIIHILDRMGIAPRVIKRASFLNVEGHKDERIFQMCDTLSADVYFSGIGAASYHQLEDYLQHGINLVYTDYQPFMYPQLYGEFIPNLSVADYVFNCGFEFPERWKEWI